MSTTNKIDKLLGELANTLLTAHNYAVSDPITAQIALNEMRRCARKLEIELRKDIELILKNIDNIQLDIEFGKKTNQKH